MSSLKTAKLSSRVWVLGGALAGIVMLAVAWLIVISPVRSDASQLRDDADSVQTQNVVLIGQNNKLRDLAEHKHQLVAELEAALNGLPSGPSLPVFSRQLAAQATAHDVTLTGVSIGSAVSSTTTAAPATTTDPTTGADTDPAATSTPSSTTATTSQAQGIPITITATGPALQELLFLRDVQKTGPRLALVTSASLAPGQGAATDGSITDSATLTLQLTVFTNPLPQTTRQQLDQLTSSTSTH